MAPEGPSRVQTLFEAALERDDDSRADWVRRQCEDDTALADEVLSLLEADAHTGGVLDHPITRPIGDEGVPAGTELSGYVVEEELGRGGFGRVYRARHPVIGKPAAIKVLYPEYSASDEHVQRFVNEARAVNEIGHPDIVDVFAFGETDAGEAYFVMELIEAPTLQALLDEREALPLAVALPLLRGLADAVDAAHDSGIVHRDLKPSNVVVITDPDGSLHPKLLDFGIAKLLLDADDGSSSLTGERIIGTPQYMSPEQARGEPVDGRTDVYAFGVLVYRALTGRLPIEGNNAMDTLLRQTAELPPPPSSVHEGVPAAVDGIVLAMLAKEADERPQRLGPVIDRLAKVDAGAGQPGRGRGWPAVAFAGAALAVIGLAWRATAGDATERAEPSPVAKARAEVSASTDPAPVDAAPIAKHEPPVPPDHSAVPPARVTLEIEGVPEGTHVLDESEASLGVAPGPIVLPLSSVPIRLVFRHRDHADAVRTVTPDADQTLAVELPPRAKRRRLNPDLESPFPR